MCYHSTFKKRIYVCDREEKYEAVKTKMQGESDDYEASERANTFNYRDAGS